MSRIFDALQRSESERSGDDSATLPQGPELLRRAERRLTSKWEAAASATESKSAKITERSGGLSREAGASDSAIMAASAITDVLSAEERSAILGRFQSLSLSLPSTSRLVCLTDRESPTAEAVRLLGVRLRDLRRIRALKKVLITSTIPQEGKSMIAANLACTLAHATEEKVLLVEGDVRLPTLLQMFGIEKVPGICEYLQEEQSLPTNIYHLEDAGLWILPAGTAPSNPLELLQSQRLSMLMDQLDACFDWIIIDSPPVLPLADTSIWMRIADGILLVTRQGTTEKEQLRKGLEALESEKMLGALLNGTMASAYSGYYYSSSRPS